MDREPRTPLARYGLAAALFAAAFAVEALLPEFFRPVIYFLFYPTSFLAAWLAGLGPALFHLALAMAGVWWLFVARDSAAPDAADMLRMALFAAFNTLAAALITRGRRAATALRASEERLRVFAALIDNSSDFIGIADPEGRPVYLNPAGRRMVGLAPDHPVSETRIPEYYPRELRAFASEVIVKAMVERDHWRGETYFRNWVTQEAIPVSDEHFMIREPGTGRVLGMGTITRDISERRRMEEALRSREADLKRAQAVARIGSWRLDIPGGELSWSDETYRIFGLPAGTPLTYRGFLDLVHPDDRAFVDAKWTAALAGEDYDIEHRIVVDGEVRWVNEKAQVEAAPEGRPLRGIGTVQDITRRKRAEDELRLLRERERYRLALEAAASAMVVVGRDGRIVFVNGEAERLFGWTRGELTGRLVEVLVPERFREGHASRRESFFRDRAEKGRPGVGRELSAVRKDGSELPVEIGLTRVEEGGEEFVVASLTDVTQRKVSEARLRQSLVELEGFAHTISHDLRAPLRAIQGFSYFLAQRLSGGADPESRALLERISAAAERLDRLIRDLLSYNAIARSEVALEAVDLDEALAHVIEHYPDLAKARLEVRAPLGRARAQPSLVIQVLANLLGNAVKFVAPGRVPEVEVWTERRSPGKVVLAVKDNGIGIPPEARDRVFAPFVRLHPPGEYEGTGIGLAIVKKAVERMGGSVCLDSEPGRGTSVWVELEEARP